MKLVWLQCARTTFFRTTVTREYYFGEEGLENQLEKIVNYKCKRRLLEVPEGSQTCATKKGEKFSEAKENVLHYCARLVSNNS